MSERTFSVVPQRAAPAVPSAGSPHLRRPRSPRALAILICALLLSLVPISAASAHVRVIPESTASGGFSVLTFRVPTESDTASTVKLVIQLPQDTPLMWVSSKPVPGWTAVSHEETLPTPVVIEGTTLTTAVRTITWTADNPAAGIAPGQYQEFSISVGPLPAPGTFVIPATQTYSDGSVVGWDEPTPASGEEPEHPAPEFTITAAEASGHEGHTASAVASQPTSSTSGWVGIGALVLAVIATLLSAIALTRTRRTGR